MFLPRITKKIFLQNVLVLLGLLLTIYNNCSYAINEEYIQKAESGLPKLVIPKKCKYNSRNGA